MSTHTSAFIVCAAQFTVKRRSHSGWQLYQCRLPKVFICPTDFTVKNIDFLKGA